MWQHKIFHKTDQYFFLNIPGISGFIEKDGILNKRPYVVVEVPKAIKTLRYKKWRLFGNAIFYRVLFGIKVIRQPLLLLQANVVSTGFQFLLLA